MNLRIVSAVLATFLMSASVHAAIPLMINHQGYVRVDGEPFTGTGQFKFGLYDGNTNQWVWTNSGEDVGSDIDISSWETTVPVVVSAGHYVVLLGNSEMATLSSSTFDTDNILLRIWFDDEVNGEEELGDQPFTSSAYAFHAASADRADLAAQADNATKLNGEPNIVKSAAVTFGNTGTDFVEAYTITLPSITTSGQPVYLTLVGGDGLTDGNSAGSHWYAPNPNGAAFLEIRRDGVTIFTTSITNNIVNSETHPISSNRLTVPPTAVNKIDIVEAGTYVYDVRIKKGDITGDEAGFVNVGFLAYEIGGLKP
jgi:hypothetical protein